MERVGVRGEEEAMASIIEERRYGEREDAMGERGVRRRGKEEEWKKRKEGRSGAGITRRRGREEGGRRVLESVSRERGEVESDREKEMSDGGKAWCKAGGEGRRRY